MNRYPEYKESGVEWIEEVPKGWNMIRCTHLFELKHIKNTSGEINLSVYRDYGVIKRDSRDDNYNRVSEDTSNYKLVEPGDFVFNKMKCWQGSLGVSEYRGIVSPAYTVCKPKRHFHGKYFHYLLRSQPYIQEFNRLSYGVRIGQWELRFEDFKDIVVLYPSLSEQTQIANFLDRKTGQIDELIRIKERRIELLQEQRTVLINQAVTKGLDPNVEMKPSGVEWIGEIPKHWTLTRLKYISKIPVTYGLNIEADRYTTEGIRLIRITDIGEGGSLAQKGVYLPEDCVPQEQMLNSYDLLFSRSGATVGKSYLHLQTGKYTSAGYLVRFNFNDYWTSKFIYYVTLSHFYRNWLEQQIIISTIQNVNGEKYSNFQLPIPLRQEQKQIVKFLDRKTGQIDELVSAEQRKIELLKEYRQSLISEAVTGKIDVRNDV
ncbi:MAG: restriction endonuclease subunit S [Candidatus Poribacteria bacterium]|nr:restriction endonuclease subunit S [Candidatus Poribacteria bacterium]